MTMPVCPNCGQWQRPENYGDCFNECAGRGFAQRASFPAPPSAHTPGPWVADGCNIYENRPGWREDGNWLPLASVSYRRFHQQYEANASLIAAAPDMLAALKACVEAAEPGEDCPLPTPLYNLVCAAIARAEGR